MRRNRKGNGTRRLECDRWGCEGESDGKRNAAEDSGRDGMRGRGEGRGGRRRGSVLRTQNGNRHPRMV